MLAPDDNMSTPIDPALADLLRFDSHEMLPPKPWVTPPPTGKRHPAGAIKAPSVETLPHPTSEPGYNAPPNVMESVKHHAPPLLPLRARDMAALEEFFDHDDMAAIEADLLRSLALLWPEPCWEDHLFDFLKEYL